MPYNESFLKAITLTKFNYFFQDETRQSLYNCDGMCCPAQYSSREMGPEPEEDEDDLIEVEDGEEHFGNEVEHDGVTARDYMAQTYFG